jgi:hypothetical protein
MASITAVCPLENNDSVGSDDETDSGTAQCVYAGIVVRVSRKLTLNEDQATYATLEKKAAPTSRIKKNESVTLIAVVGSHAKVQTADRREGWIRTKYILDWAGLVAKHSPRRRRSMTMELEEATRARQLALRAKQVESTSTADAAAALFPSQHQLVARGVVTSALASTILTSSTAAAAAAITSGATTAVGDAVDNVGDDERFDAAIATGLQRAAPSNPVWASRLVFLNHYDDDRTKITVLKGDRLDVVRKDPVRGVLVGD